MVGDSRRRTKGPGKAGVVKKCSTNGALSRRLPVRVTFAVKATAVSEMIIAHAFGFGKLGPVIKKGIRVHQGVESEDAFETPKGLEVHPQN
jgi:hypothetical protein